MCVCAVCAACVYYGCASSISQEGDKILLPSGALDHLARYVNPSNNLITLITRMGRDHLVRSGVILLISVVCPSNAVRPWHCRLKVSYPMLFKVYSLDA
jgi:hypothetical protein